jgi:hypothetical protein
VIEDSKVEEVEIADDKGISEIAEEDVKEEVHTIEIGKMEEEIEKRDRLRFIGQTTACNNGQECQVGIAGLEICWPSSKCTPG